MAIWKCAGREIEYGHKPLIMGIVNVTPDSFSDGGMYFSVEKAVNHAMELVEDGADIIDLGGQSTRPGHTEICDEEEWARLELVVAELLKLTDIPLSVDTYYPAVAKNALRHGVSIINDVSGRITQKMASIIRETKAGWVLMHNGSGTPTDVKRFFEKSAKECELRLMDLQTLCFDMGIGFGKNYDEDMTLITNASEYKLEGYPLLLGCSRKRVIGAGSDEEIPTNRIYGNIAADTAAIFGGADIIRVHDVKNEKHGIEMAWNMKGYRHND